MPFENSPLSNSIKKEQMPYATLENKEELKRVTQEIHSVRPDVVLFTMTSAFNIAVALKEVWKSAYPDEEVPLFIASIHMGGKVRMYGKNFRLRWKN